MHPCKILHSFVRTVFRRLLSMCSCGCIAFVFDVGAVRFSLKERANIKDNQRQERIRLLVQFVNYFIQLYFYFLKFCCHCVCLSPCFLTIQMKATEKTFHAGLFILLSKSCSTVVVNLVLFSIVFRLVVVDFFKDFYV